VHASKNGLLRPWSVAAARSWSGVVGETGWAVPATAIVGPPSGPRLRRLGHASPRPVAAPVGLVGSHGRPRLAGAQQPVPLEARPTLVGHALTPCPSGSFQPRSAQHRHVLASAPLQHLSSPESSPWASLSTTVSSNAPGFDDLGLGGVALQCPRRLAPVELERFQTGWATGGPDQPVDAPITLSLRASDCCCWAEKPMELPSDLLKLADVRLQLPSR